MALRAVDSTLTPYEEWQSSKRDRIGAVVDDDGPELTDEEHHALKTAKYCLRLMDDAVQARRPYETFDDAWDLFIGNVWSPKHPNFRAKITLNKIRAFIIFMQAVMTDNKPRLSVEPVVPGSEDAADLLGKLVDRHWDENSCQDVITLAALYDLIWGTGIVKSTVEQDPDTKEYRHVDRAIVPYRIFVNRTATSVEDAEYLVHVEEETLGWVARHFPAKLQACVNHAGARVRERLDVDRDFVREGTVQDSRTLENAMRTTNNNIVPGNGKALRDSPYDDQETIEVAEFWFRDDTREEYQVQKTVNGVPQFAPITDKYGLPEMDLVDFEATISPLDGLAFQRPVYRAKQKPVMQTKTRRKYPNGRLVIMAGPVMLRDIPNPYQIDGFPFSSCKDIDVGAFWGQGEPLTLKDASIAMNRIASQVFDILDKTGNPSWKYKKGSGLDTRSIKNKAGTLIPLDELNALEPLEKPQIHGEFLQLFGLLEGMLGKISGLQDSVMGNLAGGNTAFATIDQLQESGAAPLRLKVRNFEKLLRRMGKLRVQLIQQFDKGKRPLRERIEPPPKVVTDPETGEVVDVVQPASEVEIRFRTYSPADIQGSVEFGIVPDSSLSTSPAGLWNRYMMLYDKHLIDRQAFHEKFRIDDYRNILKRMNQADAAAAQAKAASKSKPGPAPSKPPRAGQRPPPPRTAVPTRLQTNAVR